MITSPLRVKNDMVLCPVCDFECVHVDAPCVEGDFITIPARCEHDHEFEIRFCDHAGSTWVNCAASEEALDRALNEAMVRAVEKGGLEWASRVIAPFSTNGKLHGVRDTAGAAHALREAVRTRRRA